MRACQVAVLSALCGFVASNAVGSDRVPLTVRVLVQATRPLLTEPLAGWAEALSTELPGTYRVTQGKDAALTIRLEDLYSTGEAPGPIQHHLKATVVCSDKSRAVGLNYEGSHEEAAKSFVKELATSLKKWPECESSGVAPHTRP